MRSKIVFVVVAVLFVATATGERPDDVKSVRSDKVSHYEVLDKVSVPSLINYQGYITDDAGNAITDTVEMTFSIWDAASEGSQLWNETQASVSVVNGLFNVLLGSITSIPSDIFTGASLWLQTQVGTEILSPRKAIVSVGHAFRAEVADAADHADEARYADTTDFAWITETATYADTSEYADSADVTGYAHGANWADSADYAVYADSAGIVGPVTYADSAGVTGYARGAEHADTADYAVYAGEATYADTANYAQSAATADYADSVGIVGTLVAPGDSLVIRDVDTNPVHKLTPDGNVWHKGLGTFEGGIVVPLAGGGKVTNPQEEAFVVDPIGESVWIEFNVFTEKDLNVNGEIYAKSFHTKGAGGSITSGVDLDGNANFKSVEVADGAGRMGPDGQFTARGYQTTNSQGNPTSSVDSDGNASYSGYVSVMGELNALSARIAEAVRANGFLVLDEGENTTTLLNSDGSGSFAGGKVTVDSDGEIYARSLHIQDESGIITSFDASGSIHKNEEIFEGGIEVEGKLIIRDTHTGKTVHEFDGDGSYHEGLEIFRGEITVTNEAAMPVHELKPDGSAEFADGKVKVDSDGEIYARSLHTTDVFGVTTSGVNSDGNANYKSVEVARQGGGKYILSNWGFDIIDAFELYFGAWSFNGNFYTAGDIDADGTKSALVSTRKYGKRKLYAEEAAEVFFIDRGQGQLVNGEVTIQLDPMFLETVTIDDDHPMLVQITLTADCNGVFVSNQTETSFTVKELIGGTSNASFNWEVAAKRKGYEDERLEEFTQVSR